MVASTNRAQRIAIWIIAIVMTLGTIGSFVVIILQNDNQSTDQSKIAQLTQEYQTAYDAYTAKLSSQATQLSKTYFETLNKYSGRVAGFEKDGVSKLGKTDLKPGGGKVLQENDSFTAYYIGWTPDGKIFDSSINGKALTNPLSVESGSVIMGWTQGVVGMKIGGIRELTIPAVLAYGEEGYGENIPSNTPLKFVIMVIPAPDKINEPEVPQELIDYYS